jgi:hypothetical protein
MDGQRQLEAAIFELEELLESADAPEEAFQDLFERHPVVLQTMGYERWVPRPRIETDGELYIPDFLAQPPNGPTEILDLKTPGVQLLVKRERRKSFTASVNSYIAQLEEYANLFDERSNREVFAAQHGLAIEADPAVVLVVGRDADTDKSEVFRQQRRRALPLSVRTFDDVRSALELSYARQCGVISTLAGAGFAAVVRFDPEVPGRRIRFVEVVDPGGPSRMAVYLDERHGLAFEVMDRDGVPYAVTTRPSQDTFSPGEFFALVCEFGSNESFTLMQLRINDRMAAELRLPHHVALAATLDLEGAYAVMGTAGEANGGKLFVREFLALKDMLSFRDRIQLARYFFHQHFDKDMTPLAGSAVEFHPMASMSTSEAQRDLTAVAKERTPTLRKRAWAR